MKSLVLATDPPDDASAREPTIWLLLVRGDHSLNEIKAGKVAGLERGFRFATAAEIESLVAACAGRIAGLFEGSGQETLNAAVLLVAVAMLGWHIALMATILSRCLTSSGSGPKRSASSAPKPSISRSSSRSARRR